MTEKRPPLTRIAVVAAILVIASAVSAVALANAGDEEVAEAGVPEGTQLTPSGSLRIVEDGAVVDALDVTGNIYVRANDVTIRRTKVTTGGYHAIRIASGYTGLVVEDSTLDCSTERGRSGIAWRNYTATRIEVGGGCRRGYVHNDAATITGSFWNGEPFADVDGTPDSTPPTTAAPEPEPPATAPPSTEAPPTTAEPTTTTTEPDNNEEPSLPPAPGGSGDFPTAANTGVPEGTQLRPSGGIDVTEPGRVIDGLDVRGTITVRAPDVTIRNTRITTSGHMGVRIDGGSLLIEDSEIIGTSNECNEGMGWAHYVARRIDVSGCLDGLKASGGSAQVFDSYIHDLRQAPGSHNDGIQSTGATGLVFEGNTICAQYRDSVSAIKLTPEKNPISDVTIRNNFLFGGNYTLYMDSKPDTFGLVTDTLVENNVFAAGSHKWAQWTIDAHPTQRLVSNTLGEMSALFSSGPCDGA